MGSEAVTFETLILLDKHKGGLTRSQLEDNIQVSNTAICRAVGLLLQEGYAIEHGERKIREDASVPGRVVHITETGRLYLLNLVISERRFKARVQRPNGVTVAIPIIY